MVTTAPSQTAQIVLARIVAHALDHTPDECCGLISRRSDGSFMTHPMANVSPNPRDYFAMDDTQLLDQWGLIEAIGGVVIAYYHSHVDTPAEPSGTDLRWAIPGLASVIVSLAGEEPVMNVWAGPIRYEGDLFES